MAITRVVLIFSELLNFTVMSYILCNKEEHYIEKGKSSCMHCNFIEIFGRRYRTKESPIDLFLGDNIYERKKNLYLFHLSLKTILESGYAKKFLNYGENKNPDLTVEFTEDYVEHLVLSINISLFEVDYGTRLRELQKLRDPEIEFQTIEKPAPITVRICTSERLFGPLCGVSYELTLKYENDKLEISGVSQRIS